MQLGPNKQSVRVEGKVKANIKKYLTDAVIYARKSTYTRCSVFEDIIHQRQKNVKITCLPITIGRKLVTVR